MPSILSFLQSKYGPLNPMDVEGFDLFKELDERSWIWLAAATAFWGFYHLFIEYEGLKCHMFAVHGLISSFLAILSINSLCEEIVPLVVSAGYFIIHLLKAIGKVDLPFVLHHLIAIALMVFCVSIPDVFAFRCGSHVLVTELSTPFLFIWRRARNEHWTTERLTFAVFLLVFFCVRPVYGILFLRRLYVEEVRPGMVPVAVFVMLWLLNVAWFSTQVRILYKYEKKKKH